MMPTNHHAEHHFTSSDVVRDVVIGMSDGLTVPFALAAGLSGAAVGTRIVVTAGLAEIAAGAVAMGLGGFLAARSDAEHYASERRREDEETRVVPETEAAEITDKAARCVKSDAARRATNCVCRPRTWHGEPHAVQVMTST